MPADDPLVLECGASHLSLAPGVGGAVLAFQHGGADILRPTPPGAADVLQAACFPLVPYANRIGRGRFAFEGRQVRLSPNMGDHPHPLHGDGWRSAWTVAEASAGHAVLILDHPAGEWPWSWRARQAFTLADGRLRIDLSVHNTDSLPMPAGLGFHPYFPAPRDTALRAAVETVWLTDAEVLPEREAPAAAAGRDWTAGAAVAGPDLVDHCYTGWIGQAEITAPGRPVTRISASPNCRWLQVYCPPGEAFFCCEPVTHRPDPFAAPDLAASGIEVLASGEVLSAWMEIAVG